jgi:hypothetical protein
MTDSSIRFRDAELAQWLRDRAGRMPLARDRRSTGLSAASGQARAELGLWRMAQEAELGRIRLTLAQARCLADVLNGDVMEAKIGVNLGLAYAGCYDAFRLARTGPAPDLSSYGAKHGPEGCDPWKWEQDLLGLLGALGPVADFALRDAVSRWWQDVYPRDASQWRDPDDQYPDDQFRADSAEGFESAGLRIAS